MSAFLAHLASRGERKVHSATVAVCLLDMAATQDTTAGLFVTPESIAAAKSASQLTGVVEGQELARMFAWMRPNDLIWNYWVNNYLLGNAPPAFDVLYWNNDTTRLPARLHADFLDLIDTNPFVNPGQIPGRAGRGGRPNTPAAGGGPRPSGKGERDAQPGAGGERTGRARGLAGGEKAAPAAPALQRDRRQYRAARAVSRGARWIR